MSTPLINPASFATIVTANAQATAVLLVEDKESDALLVHAALAGSHDSKLNEGFFTIRTAGLLSAARHRLAAEHFDVILLDLSLPDSKSHEDSFSQVREYVPARLKLVAAQAQERHRITGELHDKTGQSIAAEFPFSLQETGEVRNGQTENSHR
ncbi:MAG TPA: hypothetical protein VJM12_00710 [Pyrinomonadaceae bacterium]|nr:hypothetical protein [Pyrinomonadaceae bacterium]